MAGGVVKTHQRRTRGRIGSADAQPPSGPVSRFCFGGDSAHGFALGTCLLLLEEERQVTQPVIRGETLGGMATFDEMGGNFHVKYARGE